ncbi:MAG TPA: lysine--tRNA ligase [bacterium]|nr:lysine--tRNA ligase [bacterium]
MNSNPVVAQIDENEIIAKKKEKIKALKSEGIHPYANSFSPANNVSQVKEFCSKTAKEELEKTGKDQKFSIAGRVMLLRVMGKLAFANIKDETGTLQVVFAKDFLKDDFDRFKRSYDVGDIVWVEGEPYVTRTGEFSILAHKTELLTKNIRPLPEKFHGLTDKEMRYRQRYLDLIMNDEVRETFKKRVKIISFIRNYMDSEGFLEVETPMMHPLVSGAAARPFITHHNALDMALYMRIAPECYLKRLLVGGMGKVYEINRNFRNEGMDVKHNPEFTMMEFYWPYATYEDQMNFTEKMVTALVNEVCGSQQVEYQGKMIDFSAPWKRMTIEESIINAGICTDEHLADRNKLIEIAVEKGLQKEALLKLSRFKIIMELFDNFVEETLWNPAFITRYPTEVSPLSRRNDENPEYSDRFELFMAGREIANAFSELNDPQQQYEAFAAQVEAKKAGDDEAIDMDNDYIRALEYGMPPAAGQGIGIDRLVMLLTDSASIRDVILFPQMRPEK